MKADNPPQADTARRDTIKGVYMVKKGSDYNLISTEKPMLGHSEINNNKEKTWFFTLL
jgi:hypothetical protein